mmetsp:Transcript_81074/g.216554  ORF Transcript_81074/g.216554 Transcript_81074/m.216554 type:complete len:208 (-) Transcript_81074:410-1033(-)
MRLTIPWARVTFFTTCSPASANAASNLLKVFPYHWSNMLADEPGTEYNRPSTATMTFCKLGSESIIHLKRPHASDGFGAEVSEGPRMHMMAVATAVAKLCFMAARCGSALKARSKGSFDTRLSALAILSGVPGYAGTASSHAWISRVMSSNILPTPSATTFSFATTCRCCSSSNFPMTDDTSFTNCIRPGSTSSSIVRPKDSLTSSS